MSENNVETTPDVGTLDIVIKDPKGLPISDLEFQVFVAGQSVFSGKTDTNGNSKTIEGLKIGSIFEVHVKTDIYLSLSNAEVGDILLGNPFSPRSGLCAKYVIKSFENILESRR